MSSALKDTTNSFRFRLPPVESQVAIGLAAGILGVCVVQFAECSIFQLLLMIAFFVIGIFAQRAWAIYIMLGTIVVLKYFLIHPSFKKQLARLNYSDVVFALILILFVAACFRFLQSGRFLQAFYPNAELGEKQEPGTRNEFPSLLGGRWWAIPLAVLLAATLLSVFHFRVPFFQEARINRLAARLIFFILNLFFGWFICRALVGLFIRRRMKTVQADVQCRSLIAKEMWKDVYAVEKRKAKIQSRE